MAAILGERRRSIERDRGQLLDAGVVANLEADAARFRQEFDAVVIELDRLAPEVEQLELDEAEFAAQREQASVSLLDDPSGVRAASAAAEVRGELRSMRAAVERSESDLRRSYERTAVLRQRAQALDAETERLRSECADAELVETPLVAEIGRVESSRRSAEARLESVMQARQEGGFPRNLDDLWEHADPDGGASRVDRAQAERAPRLGDRRHPPCTASDGDHAAA